MGAGGIQARCSHCGYSRQFSPELGGRYFRCPRCKQGVLAVPRPSAEEAEAWEETHGAWLEKSRKSLLIPESDSDAGHVESGSGDERPGAPDEPPALLPGQGMTPAVAPAAARASHRGEVAPARTLLVECGLCRFMVRIPAEFFGKTVHCPSCAGATVFSESTLEPVKDELLDRLMLETREREVLFPPAETGKSRRTALRWMGVGLLLGALVPGAVLLVREVDRHMARSASVAEAEEEGWRWGLDTSAMLVHEPWCSQLRLADQRAAADQLEPRLAEGYKRHECR